MDRGKLDNGRKGLTVIVIGTRWGTLNFQVARLAVVLSLIVVALLVILSLYAIVGIVEGAGQIASKDALKDLKEARSQLESVQKDNARLRDRVQSLENQFITVGKKPPSSGGDAPTTAVSPPVKPFEASLDQFIIRHHPEDASYRFQFVLRASGLKRNRASGYIFVILKSERGGTPASQSYPTAELKDGRPQNYQSGDHFAVSRQKTIKGVIKKIADPNLYQKASVLIYSEEGVLLLETNYDLKGP